MKCSPPLNLINKFSPFGKTLITQHHGFYNENPIQSIENKHRENLHVASFTSTLIFYNPIQPLYVSMLRL